MAPLLLRAEPYFETIRSASLDFQTRVGRPISANAGAAAPCVMVLTRADDNEIDELSLSLAAEGVPLLRLDSDRCMGEVTSWDPLSGVITWGGDRFRPVVRWRRYFIAESIAADDPTMALYAREQWMAFVTALGPVGRAINPGCLPGVPDRITQLAAARDAGMRVPASLVTTRPADALDVIPGSADLLVKSLGQHLIEHPPGRMRGVFPRRISRRELRDEHDAEPGPVLVQEFIDSARELRVHAVGGQFIAYAITRPTPASLWTQPDSIAVAPVSISAELTTQLTQLVRAFHLDIAAFDLLDAPEPVFLEVNPEGSWLWAERRCGTDAISRAARDLILRTFNEEDR